jgi:FkbM family methyltransferase
MATGIRWGGFASFGEFLWQKDAPGPALREYAKHVLRKGSTVVDIGANLGAFSLYVCSTGLKCHNVYAFEPVPETFGRLQENLGRNGFCAHVGRLAFGAAESHETTIAYYPGSPSTASVASARSRVDKGLVTARMTTVDRFVEESGLGSVDLLKLDVEGYELEVIRGSELSLRDGRIRAICLEVCPANLRRYYHIPGELYDSLLAHGFGFLSYDAQSRGSLREMSREAFCNVQLDDVLCIRRSEEAALQTPRAERAARHD